MIGKQVDIINKSSWAYGEWGVIKDFDGEYYYIAIANGDETLIFKRNEFRVRRIKHEQN